MNEEKDRLKKRMDETRLPGKDLRPSYLHPILWEQLLKSWDREGHKHMSEVGSKAETRLKLFTVQAQSHSRLLKC